MVGFERHVFPRSLYGTNKHMLGYVDVPERLDNYA